MRSKPSRSTARPTHSSSTPHRGGLFGSAQRSHSTNAKSGAPGAATRTQPAPHSSGLMGTLAASATGAIAGSALSRAMFGNSQPVEEYATGDNSAVQGNDTFNPTDSSGQHLKAHPCAPEMNNFIQCMESNHEGSDFVSCRWPWETFEQCHRKFPQRF
mmetsp:Transcript_5495/g.7108  ORF Transcript_5495/g.7108 Transcript_5495/m.7108 type:complete len:158 (+) Transcript_5495:65-538(+)|eukprot:CAMPEP_0201491976 /NCGR_PEP_ID=MMETSP0151_2-20130828/31995_1 /ASSEMBLY_ACC=CAM_ASM_000257 /TAXON_ID=200890 /ORGANISM="Paramoeba atlantica, Strain 621/1 / CCAP 1560/9" /LENGTH=157 /DNA_ID=CAMNT_0047878615 /DNA_START=43 /DNA_END=516 /DNA_ORIENTATION=-